MDEALKNAHRNRYKKILPLLSEKDQRIVLGSDAEVFGYGGVSLVSQLSGASRATINLGKKQLNGKLEIIDTLRIRKDGGGRKKATEKHKGLEKEIESMMEPIARDDAQSALRWTCASTRNLSDALKKRGYSVSHKIVGRLLAEMGYSLQSNVKTFAASSQHPDRNEQFNYINEKANSQINRHEPVISVDTKKTDLLENYKNSGKDYRKHKNPPVVNDPVFGKESVSPNRLHDVAESKGFVNLANSYDTSQFAVDSIKQWYDIVGKRKYPNARKLLITAAGGGNNGYHARFWKTYLQKFATESKLEITVCHFPPGTSKWDKIEHRFFCQISLHLKAIPYVDIETIVQLIGAVSTKGGLKGIAKKEENEYDSDVKISDEKMEELNLFRHKFHGGWNYTIKPNL